MVKPLNFVYYEGTIYFHSAREGEKIDDIGRNNRVCFEVDLPVSYVKGTMETRARRTISIRASFCSGKAFIVEEPDEKRKALGALMEKYQPGGGYGQFLEAKLAVTAVVRIDIETVTGKQDLG